MNSDEIKPVVTSADLFDVTFHTGSVLTFTFGSAGGFVMSPKINENSCRSITTRCPYPMQEPSRLWHNTTTVWCFTHFETQKQVSNAILETAIFGERAKYGYDAYITTNCRNRGTLM